MESLIEVFRMNEISIQTRIKIIKELGKAINHSMSANCTEPLVYELVLALDPENPIKDDKYYTMYTVI